jgi:hypothetical protein
MIQEIITYIIIAAAVTLAILKTVNRFSKKKPKKLDYKKAKLSTDHNCGQCAAECMLRDAPRHIIETSQAECTTQAATDTLK